MKFKTKAMLFTLASGALALNTGACVLQFFGDLLGDALAFLNNPI
jgi:hypothetical protein